MPAGDVIVVDDSTDEEVAVGPTSAPSVEDAPRKAPDSPHIGAPLTKKPRVEEAIVASNNSRVNASVFDADTIKIDDSDNDSFECMPDDAITLVPELPRRNRRSFADSIPFGELQAQQRALEHLQALANRGKTVRKAHGKAKRERTWFVPPPKPSLPHTAPQPPAEEIPTYLSDSDLDFEPTPAQLPNSRKQPGSLLVLQAVESTGLLHQGHNSAIDNYNDSELRLQLQPKAQDELARPIHSRTGAAKRKRPSNLHKKSRGPLSSSRCQSAAYKQVETPIVSDILPCRRGLTDTVVHNTAWRQCYFDRAPANVLSSTAGTNPHAMPQLDPPLSAYDKSGRLEERCKLVPAFAQDARFDVPPPSLQNGQDPAQVEMDEKVSRLKEEELPKIRHCYEMKTNVILKDARSQAAAYLQDLESHRRKIRKHTWSVQTLHTSPIERWLCRRMEVPEKVPQSEHSKLKYFAGRGESNVSEHKLEPAYASRLCRFLMQSRSTAFIGIKRSVRVEDDKKFRRPYLGDDESGEEIDLSHYEEEDANKLSALDSEVDEYFLRLVVAECGDSEKVFNALKTVYGFTQPFDDYSEIKKAHDSKRLVSHHIEDAKALVRGTASEADETQRQQLAKLLQLTSVLRTSDTALTSLAERLAPPISYFESNLAGRHSDDRASKLGVRSTSDYAGLSVHYRDLFCRMCYKYDCPEHGIEHPQPSRRVDPFNPPSRLSAVVTSIRSGPDESDDRNKSTPADPANVQVHLTERSSTIAVEESIVNIEEDENDSWVDGNGSTGSSLPLDRRRSDRSQTKANSLATAFLDIVPLSEKSKSSRSARAKVVRKAADESEYLDDSHYALVTSMVGTFVGTTEMCSDTCWKSKSAPCVPVMRDQGVTEGVERVNGGTLDVGLASMLSPAELVLIRKTRDTVGGNPCMIAAVVKSVACKDLHAYLATDQQSTGRRNGSMDDASFSSDVQTDKTRKREKFVGSHNGNHGLLKSRARNHQLKEKGSNYEYEPCNHEGKCDSSGCSCMDRKHMCEKACSCPHDCPNRFPGCRCSMGNCRTKACPCFIALRECNPDVCFTCGASEVPVVIYNEELRDRPATDLGICCNVNIQRGHHKKLGVSFSTTHGWGAFTREPIKRGEFIYEYKGAIISQEEAERRGAIYDKLAISFLFDANEDAVLDAARKGNKSKFANHSSVNPKCKAKVFRVGGEHRISIWAQQDIKKGEELFFDYGYSGESAPDWSQAPSFTHSSSRHHKGGK